MEIELTIQDPTLVISAEGEPADWEPLPQFAPLFADVVSIAEFAALHMGIHHESEIAISIVDVEEMERLHIEWMDLPGPTDVLSFPMDEMVPHSASEGPGIIGDIVLCPTFVVDQAKEHGKTLGQELCLLTVHGVLHCLGYDHADKEEEKEMFALQDKIVELWTNGAGSPVGAQKPESHSEQRS
jgi:probable rRNA maturation factor